MTEIKTWIGRNPVHRERQFVEGGYVEMDGDVFYRIANCDWMRPFFITVVSPTDHWLFASSNGGLTTGRRSPETALFPYDTDDKITENTKRTGNKTIIKLIRGGRQYLWEPLSDRHQGIYHVERNLYKNREGCVLIFEEVNHDLEATFQVSLSTSGAFGFVRKVRLINLSSEKLEAEIVDGIQNLLPYGVDTGMQQMRSNLVDAYKKNELDTSTDIGFFSLSSMIVDRAEPSEALKATVAWYAGIEADHVLLSGLQLDAFRRGEVLETEHEVKAEKGAYFIKASLSLEAMESRHWYILGDVNQSMVHITNLRQLLDDRSKLPRLIEEELLKTKTELREMIGSADGIQLTRDQLSSGRHFSNVLFNIMRGGTFEDQYFTDKNDLFDHISNFNREVAVRHQTLLKGLPSDLDYLELQDIAQQQNDKDFERLCMEYLPLSFSRRHGDPSRPWNYFTIDTRDEKGQPVKNYEGNWRDIFQNWEALAFSFPEYIEGMIARFVNASTIDGYNPYRIMRNGIDWEESDPKDPWSYIGYWGDHQIIYLLKLMELSARHHPERLKEMLVKDIFVYANVPYVIRGYDAILMNPSETIDFNDLLAGKIEKRVAEIGGDGKLSLDAKGNLVRANLCEKLLVTSLTKLYNLVPGGGIWLNTQRPEWNDANNALVGNGVSMVTLCYLNRFIAFVVDFLSDLGEQEVELNKPVADLLDALHRGFKVRKHLLDGDISNAERRKLMDRFGIAGEHYRTSAYSGFLGQKQRLPVSEIVEFFNLAKLFVQRTIDINKREDGLYHSYNLLALTDDEAHIANLYEMLEGQVAVLSAGHLSPKEGLDVLNALKASAMYREDQYSYMLYPDRELPPFYEKNNIFQARLSSSDLVKSLMKAGNHSLVEKDALGTFHFHGSFRNSNDVQQTLDSLGRKGFAQEVDHDQQFILDLFEELFNHKAFTGRSGTFFGYEGLGCIYWHMVSKLLLAIQENIAKARQLGAEDSIIGGLVEHYYEVRAGIGLNKSPELYGAFPTDAYSHTPKGKGAQQPGMTGQVKEDVINRWAELGVKVREGRLYFEPTFLREEEFLIEPDKLSYIGLNGEWKSLLLSSNTLAFTYCQVPIIYQLGKTPGIEIELNEGTINSQVENGLSKALSQSVFARDGQVKVIRVNL